MEGAGASQWLDTLSGVRRGSTLSPLLLIVYMDLVIRKVAANQEEHDFTLANADDIAQITAYETELGEIMNRWNTVFNEYHLKLYLQKTEGMMIGKVHHDQNIKIG